MSKVEAKENYLECFLPKAEPGWLITDVEDIDWVGEVVSQETELF